MILRAQACGSGGVGVNGGECSHKIELRGDAGRISSGPTTGVAEISGAGASGRRAWRTAENRARRINNSVGGKSSAFDGETDASASAFSDRHIMLSFVTCYKAHLCCLTAGAFAARFSIQRVNWLTGDQYR
jgi:hypothetical protein